MNEAYRMGGGVICMWRLANHRVWNSGSRKTLVLAPTRWRHDPWLFVLNSQASRSTTKSSLHLPLLKEHWYYRHRPPNMALSELWGFKLRSFLRVTEPSSQHKRILESLNLIFQDQTESTHSTKDSNESKW